MDTTAKLKDNLILRIKNSKDVGFLKVLQVLFDASEKPTYELTEEQQNAINESREEIKRGDFVANEEVMSKTKEWLKNR
ncbi:MAG: hypothetical protein COZ75_05655 [Flavobacteriaceae bacterium CG_4_8_14_3_um_filter_34_10]|nr:MAG: hypothetical protein AUK33_04970 [Flavobacteriaceae bacterium CG2_30_34_30]PIQ17416.1 MAG: hypothetical protein COW66_11865 [Flavobacteriaceae bacterium CG18_big_fil_WC_8_21_14_2_50_34_36]PIV50656.1 MAG: hypothetical protein COS19_03625 [Flavobacteriaceae bacterium CG02_land_8_20_14_3_00_34_13]PIX09652.1 MAG: hypothetical protein COZ75_05655 [Flavobacteriaceae bacterium CG_4_8_14_3_um_filter_34_10]PIZ08722.1 MAG: hypothetical protein COY56_02435 [Flavobacteriaceae bacterium CG_4_10_14_0